MNRTTATLTCLLLTLAASVQAQEFRLRLQEKPDERVHQGRAELQLGPRPTLTLRSDAGDETLVGERVVGGYLFAADRSLLQQPERDGIADRILGARAREGTVRFRALRRYGTKDRSTRQGFLHRGQRVEILQEEEGMAQVRPAGGYPGWIRLADDQGNPTLELGDRELPKRQHLEGEERSVFLFPHQGGFRGHFYKGSSFQGKLSLRPDFPTPRQRTKRVLLIPDLHHDGDGPAFVVYARRLRDYYQPRGYEVVIFGPENQEETIELLESSAAAPFSRMVMIGHGGWDGHSLRGFLGASQVSGKMNMALFERYVAALRVGMTRDAKIYNSSCHAAGTGRFEDVSFTGSRYRWVHDVAHRTGLLVAGAANKTSTEYTQQQVLATLEDTGSVVQEVHVAQGERLRILLPGQSLRSRPLQQLPEILDLKPVPQPEPSELALADAEGELATTPGFRSQPLGED